MLTREEPKDAARVEFGGLRRTRATRRVEMAVELTTLARELAIAGIRACRPEATPEQLEHEYRNLVFGVELAEKVRMELITRGAAPAASGSARADDLLHRIDGLLARIRAEAKGA